MHRFSSISAFSLFFNFILPIFHLINPKIHPLGYSPRYNECFIIFGGFIECIKYRKNGVEWEGGMVTVMRNKKNDVK